MTETLPDIRVRLRAGSPRVAVELRWRRPDGWGAYRRFELKRGDRRLLQLARLLDQGWCDERIQQVASLLGEE